LIIRNIPDHYARKTLLKSLDVAKTYDYFYFENGQPKHWICFHRCAAVLDSVLSFEENLWKRFNSSNKCEIDYATGGERPLLLTEFNDCSAGRRAWRSYSQKRMSIFGAETIDLKHGKPYIGVC
jgi:hypothetical protein